MTTPLGESFKGIGIQDEEFNGKNLRVLIVQARWNATVISALVQGAIKVMIKSGVESHNIIIQTVPGSYELPMACSRLIASSRLPEQTPFDACIAIGTLIKGSTSHYEYISDAVTHGLMRVQLDTGVPVIYGVLNCFTEEQALQRAGMGTIELGHNHGEDWGNAAVELGVKNARWTKGEILGALV